MNEQLDENELVKEFNELICQISSEVAVRSMSPELIDSYKAKLSQVAGSIDSMQRDIDSYEEKLSLVLGSIDSMRKEMDKFNSMLTRIVENTDVIRLANMDVDKK